MDLSGCMDRPMDRTNSGATPAPSTSRTDRQTYLDRLRYSAGLAAQSTGELMFYAGHFGVGVFVLTALDQTRQHFLGGGE